MDTSGRFAGSLLPPRPSMILRPGMPVLPPGVERYRVKGRGATVVKVAAGDRVTIRDVEGGQRASASPFRDRPRGYWKFSAGTRTARGGRWPP